MRKPIALLFSTSVLLSLVAACTSVVSLDPGHFPSRLPSESVRVVDARELDRGRLERILEEHYTIGRFDISIPGGDDFERKLEEAVENGKRRVLASGGNVLLFTDQSDMLAVLKRDARYAGSPDAITMYVMLPRR